MRQQPAGRNAHANCANAAGHCKTVFDGLGVGFAQVVAGDAAVVFNGAHGGDQNRRIGD